MDSTFMGTLAGISLRQKREGTGRTIVVNLGPQALRLLEILGMGHVLDVRESHEGAHADRRDFRPGRPPELTRIDRAIHMIQAHERLVGLDNDNEVKFEGVLDFLRESLARERRKQEK
jgi:hypothetical protein